MTTDYILEEEMEHVLAALTSANRLVMRVILHTGMRLSDVLSLRSEQLKPFGWYTERKTGKRRRYGLPRELLVELKEQAGVVWVFESRLDPNKHRSRQTVWRDVKRACKAFRLPVNLGPHSARKSYAVDLMRRYGDIERVRRALNHDNSSVTAIYAMADILTQRRLDARQRRLESRRRQLEETEPGK